MKQHVLKHRCSILLWADSSLVSTAECRFACCHQQDVNRRWCFLVICAACVLTLRQPSNLLSYHYDDHYDGENDDNDTDGDDDDEQEEEEKEEEKGGRDV